MSHGETSPEVDDLSFVDPPPNYLDFRKLYDPGGGEQFNINAAGPKTGNCAVIVSHGYSWELKTPERSVTILGFRTEFGGN